MTVIVLKKGELKDDIKTRCFGNIFISVLQTMNRFLLHSELPQPIRFKDINTSRELDDILQNFIDTYSATATRFITDDDNVGRGSVCAFIRDSSEMKGVMVYAKRNEIKEYLTIQGFQCRLKKVSPSSDKESSVTKYVVLDYILFIT